MRTRRFQSRCAAGASSSAPPFEGFSIPLVNGELTFSPDGTISIPTAGLVVTRVSPNELRFRLDGGAS